MERLQGPVRERRLGVAIVTRAVVAIAGISVASADAPAADWVAEVFKDRRHDFGTVARGSVLRHRFKVTNGTDREVRISGWKPKCGCTKVEVGARVIPPGAQTTIEAVLDTTQYRGYKGSGVTVYTEQPGARSVDLDLTCFIQDEVVVEPGVVDFGTVQRDSEPEVVLGLEYRGGQPNWSVVRMRTISDAVSARLEELSRSESGLVRYRLIARLEPGALRNGSFRDEIRIVTNDPERREIPLSVSATVASNVALSPAVLNLGTLRPGQEVERVVLLRSRQPFRVESAEPIEGQIALAEEPSDEERPLHKVRVSIEAPTEPGAHHAILEIATDLPGEPPARLTTFATVRP